MAAATGLYGHIQDNQRRSLLLFLLFAVAFQLLAAVALVIPLLIFDPAHAPLLGSLGYATRYMPMVALLLLGLFAAQMWWFVGGVREATHFHYVDNSEEPRFCRILEPLAIAAGIRIPFAGVIPSASLNAFAAGVRDRHMVVVATRGLLDALDDDELAGVLANAVIHIRNRDTRLLAAATIFMRNMTLFQKERGLKLDHPIQAVALVVLPMMVPVMLVMGFLIQLAFRIGYGSRALIGISRELIADAESVRLTLNPAAMVSALRKLDQHHRIDGVGDEYAAMLIYGVPHGPLATHPTLDERLGALARTTGSLVLDRSVRLDTRAARGNAPALAPQPLDAALERIALLGEAPPKRGFWGAFRSVRDPDRNVLGLNRRGVVILAAALVGIALVYKPNWSEPRSVAAVFDPTVFHGFFGVGPALLKCTFGLGEGLRVHEDCENQAIKGGALFAHVPGMATDGTLGGTPAPRQDAATAVRARMARGCFPGRWDGFADIGEAGGAARAGLASDVYVRFGARGTAGIADLRAGPAMDDRLADYAASRLLLIENSLHFHGEPGLAAFNRAVDSAPHRAAIAMLAARLVDPGFGARLGEAERANLEMLVAHPLALRPCWARPTPRAS